MRQSTSVQLRTIALALALGLSAWAVATSPADAGHVKGTNGSCVNSPVICRNMWGGGNGHVYVRAWDQFSSQAPHWSLAASYAVASWYFAPGPTRVSFSYQTVLETYAYIKWGETGYGGLDADDRATNWNCFPSCSNDPDTTGVIQWSEFYLNSSLSVMLSGGSPYVWQKSIAHEMGHGLGLAHHQNDQHLMRSGTTSESHPNGPVSGDLGAQATPPCSQGTSSRGIRCIYHWNLN